VVAEAEQGTLEDLLSRLENVFSRYISDKEIDWFPATGKFKDFRVEF
jgi:hypothetical protein